MFKKKQFIQGVQHYLWFQASTGGFGPYPPQIRGDYDILILDVNSFSFHSLS